MQANDRGEFAIFHNGSVRHLWDHKPSVEELLEALILEVAGLRGDKGTGFDHISPWIPDKYRGFKQEPLDAPKKA